MFFVLLPAVLVAVVSAVALAGHGGSVLAARPARGPGAGTPLHALAAFAGAAALTAYAWGLLHVTGAVMESNGGADSAPAPPCRMPGHEDRARHVVDQSVSFLPPGFVCETSDGDGYTTDDVPGYVNPAVAVLALTGAGSAIAAGYATERRARAGGGRDRALERPRRPRLRCGA
ncbi:hypothetical protein [Streptomyces lancefieldiae]|uniref:Integral membrane protein n=1 Tax=Streptomyces lancefieldiae TaxID=3075520 RepID=A0ABU3AKE8_9ACTN|nr:hypothetical protein [Streptomyces sp. DSM 40712]MDT0610654.1 hypothetical protein [Streptomyces sp. DSM 40712]